MELVGSRSQSKQHATQRSNENDNDDVKDERKNGNPRHCRCSPRVDNPNHRAVNAICELPTLPDLPDPPPITGPYFPPFPPGVMSCSAQWNSRGSTIVQNHVNWRKAIERAYNAKCAPFNAAIDDKVDEIDNHLDQILKKEEQKLNWIILLYPNLNAPQITNLEKEIQGHEETIKALKKEISKLQDDLGKIWDWRKKWLAWAGEKRQKATEAADAEYQDCVANEQDND